MANPKPFYPDGYDPFEVGGAPIAGARKPNSKRSVLDGREDDLKEAIRIAAEEDERLTDWVAGKLK